MYDKHMHSTSLTLSHSLCVIRMFYIWSNKDYKLALTLYNFKVALSHHNHKLSWANYYYYKC